MKEKAFNISVAVLVAVALALTIFNYTNKDVLLEPDSYAGIPSGVNPCSISPDFPGCSSADPVDEDSTEESSVNQDDDLSFIDINVKALLGRQTSVDIAQSLCVGNAKLLIQKRASYVQDCPRNMAALLDSGRSSVCEIDIDVELLRHVPGISWDKTYVACSINIKCRAGNPGDFINKACGNALTSSSIADSDATFLFGYSSSEYLATTYCKENIIACSVNSALAQIGERDNF